MGGGRAARGARRPMGAVRGQDHRGLAPHRQAHRDREEVEYLAVGIPEEGARTDPVSRRELPTLQGDMIDLTPFWDWFRELYATTGIKLTIFYDAFDRARFFNGFLTSVRLMTLCIVCSVAIGVLGARAQGSRLRLLRALTAAYIEFFRNTPPLVQLYFFYFALGSYLRTTNNLGLA